MDGRRSLADRRVRPSGGSGGSMGLHLSLHLIRESVRLLSPRSPGTAFLGRKRASGRSTAHSTAAAALGSLAWALRLRRGHSLDGGKPTLAPACDRAVCRAKCARITRCPLRDALFRIRGTQNRRRPAIESLTRHGDCQPVPRTVPVRRRCALRPVGEPGRRCRWYVRQSQPFRCADGLRPPARTGVGLPERSRPRMARP